MKLRRIAVVLALTLALLAAIPAPVESGCEIDIETFRTRNSCVQCLVIICCFLLPDGELSCSSDVDCWDCQFSE